MIEKTYIDICERENMDADIIPYYCGYEECDQGYHFGPLVRDQYILHYIVKGGCILEEGNAIYHLHEMQGFIVFPQTPIYFKADSKEKFCHYWIGFGGKKTQYYLNKLKFSVDHPVYTYNADMKLCAAMRTMHCLDISVDDNELELLYLLYQIFFLLNFSSKQLKPQAIKRMKYIYVRKTVEIITMNYFTKTSIDDIAKKVNIDKKYLSSIFKDLYGITPYKLLTEYRILKAGELLYNPDLSISEIARSVGYGDPLHFSKVFKQKKGIPPEKYRESLLKGKEV